jgi:hypothetical protein
MSVCPRIAGDNWCKRRQRFRASTVIELPLRHSEKANVTMRIACAFSLFSAIRLDGGKSQIGRLDWVAERDEFEPPVPFPGTRKSPNLRELHPPFIVCDDRKSVAQQSYSILHTSSPPCVHQMARREQRS